MRAGAVNSNVFPPSLANEEERLSPRAFSFVGCATNKRSLRKDLNREGPKARDSSAKDRSQTLGDLNGKVACRPRADSQIAASSLSKRSRKRP